jgi:hypothetical protein
MNPISNRNELCEGLALKSNVGPDAMQAVLVDQTEFRLPPEEWEAFCLRLGAPARTIPALAKLFRESKPYDLAMTSTELEQHAPPERLNTSN